MLLRLPHERLLCRVHKMRKKLYSNVHEEMDVAKHTEQRGEKKIMFILCSQL
jgi:hypothetical protein